MRITIERCWKLNKSGSIYGMIVLRPGKPDCDYLEQPLTLSYSFGQDHISIHEKPEMIRLYSPHLCLSCAPRI